MRHITATPNARSHDHQTTLLRLLWFFVGLILSAQAIEFLETRQIDVM